MAPNPLAAYQAGARTPGRRVILGSQRARLRRQLPVIPGCRSGKLSGAPTLIATSPTCFHARSVRNVARTSETKSAGCSQAAKWVPMGWPP